MIVVEKCSFSYPGSKQQALRRVHFSLEQGRILCLAGPNGCGKSTLLLLLAGLYTPDAGTLYIGQYSSPRQTKLFKNTARMVLQDPEVMILGGDVKEDIMLGIADDEPDGEQRAMAAAARFGLADDFHTPVSQLSYGMKRKLCLASVLAGAGPEVRVLLLDEPFAGLDYPSKLEMREILQENKHRGLTQVVAVHDMEPVIDLADYLAVMHTGAVELYGRPEEILDKARDYGVRPPCSWTRARTITLWE